MSPQVLEFLQAASALIPLIVKAGEDVTPFIVNIVQSVMGGNQPTADDWAALQAKESALRARLQNALSAEEESQS